jgi:hypothetical protein
MKVYCITVTSVSFHLQLIKTSKDIKNQNMKMRQSQHQCDQCSYEYTSTEKLATHKKTKHEGKWYTCDQCDHREPYEGEMFSHIQKMHGTGLV